MLDTDVINEGFGLLRSLVLEKVKVLPHFPR